MPRSTFPCHALGCGTFGAGFGGTTATRLVAAALVERGSGLAATTGGAAFVNFSRLEISAAGTTSSFAHGVLRTTWLVFSETNVPLRRSPFRSCRTTFSEKAASGSNHTNHRRRRIVERMKLGL